MANQKSHVRSTHHVSSSITTLIGSITFFLSTLCFIEAKESDVREARMAVCPKCNIAYEAGKKYCRKCGSLLLTEEKPFPGFKQIDLPEGETTEEKLLCPKCKVLYEIGNYCRKCGSLLMEKGTFQETNVQPSGKRLVKRRAKEWLTLLREKKKLEG